MSPGCAAGRDRTGEPDAVSEQVLSGVAHNWSARLISVVQAFDRPETLLIIMRDEAGVMAGVISRTDIVARISHCTGRFCTEAVETAMTTYVQICVPSDPVRDIWSRMKQMGFMHMPAIDGARRPLGVLAARDVPVTLLEVREHEESLLMDYVNGVGYR